MNKPAKDTPERIRSDRESLLAVLKNAPDPYQFSTPVALMRAYKNWREMCRAALVKVTAAPKGKA